MSNMDLIWVVSLSWVLVLSSEAENTCPDMKIVGLGEEAKLAIFKSCPGLVQPLGTKRDRGATGEKGEKGSPGIIGKMGPKGDSGSPGTHGIKGDTGQPGSQGIKGSKGDSASTGGTGAKNCKDVLKQGSSLNGWYNIYPDGVRSIPVMCDLETESGGWIVFQRRQDGSVDFYRDWNSYKKGFGNQMGEFWLGNDNLHTLTKTGTFQLRVDFTDFENQKSFAVYSDFHIASESEKYKLKIGTYTAGDAGDSLKYHNDRPFSTKDKDNDDSGNNCAIIFKGAWWYGDCHHSNLNGQYLGGPHSSYAEGINWKEGKGHNYSYKVTEMKFRPKQ